MCGEVVSWASRLLTITSSWTCVWKACDPHSNHLNVYVSSATYCWVKPPPEVIWAETVSRHFRYYFRCPIAASCATGRYQNLPLLWAFLAIHKHHRSSSCRCWTCLLIPEPSWATCRTMLTLSRMTLWRMTLKMTLTPDRRLHMTWRSSQLGSLSVISVATRRAISSLSLVSLEFKKFLFVLFFWIQAFSSLSPHFWLLITWKIHFIFFVKLHNDS